MENETVEVATRVETYVEAIHKEGRDPISDPIVPSRTDSAEWFDRIARTPFPRSQFP